jgi:hypothetical protein
MLLEEASKRLSNLCLCNKLSGTHSGGTSLSTSRLRVVLVQLLQLLHAGDAHTTKQRRNLHPNGWLRAHSDVHHEATLGHVDNGPGTGDAPFDDALLRVDLHIVFAARLQGLHHEVVQPLRRAAGLILRLELRTEKVQVHQGNLSLPLNREPKGPNLGKIRANVTALRLRTLRLEQVLGLWPRFG